MEKDIERPSINQILESLNARNVEIRAPISEMYRANKMALEAVKKYAQKNGLGSRDLVVIVPNNSVKEFAKEALSPEMDAAEILTPYELIHRFSYENHKKLITEDLLLSTAYSTLPKTMDEKMRIEAAREMVNALEILLNMKIDLNTLESSNFKDAFVNIVNGNRVYLKNSNLHMLGEKDAKDFVKIFTSFLEKYKALKDKGYYGFEDITEKAKLQAKVAVSLNVSDFSPLFQQIISNMQADKKVYTSSTETLYSFLGADAKKKNMNTGRLDYYLSTDVYFVLPEKENKSKTVKEGIVAKDLVYGAVEAVKDNLGNIAVVVPSNYFAWLVSAELDKEGISHTAFLSISINDKIKEDFVSFVQALISKRENRKMILSGIYNSFSPVSVDDFIKYKEDFLSGKEILAFKPFFEMQEKAQNKEGLIEVLEDAVKRFEKATNDIRKIKTAYAMLERAKSYDPTLDIDFVAWLESTDLSENYIASGSPEIVVGTPHKLIGTAHFPVLIYVNYQYREGKSLSDALIESALGISNNNRKPIKASELIKSINAEKIVVVSGNYETMLEFGVESIRKSEGTVIKDVALFSNAGKVKEYIKSYLSGLDRIHYSFLSLVNKPLELYREILGIRQTSLLAELGEKVHEAIAQGKRPEEVDEQIVPFVKNAEELIKQLEQQGYKVVEREKMVSVPYSEFAKRLGIWQHSQNQKDFVEAYGTPDCIMKKGNEYLILDYKTGQSTYFDEEYVRQLAFYRILVSASEGIPINKIRLAILHIGLRGPFEEAKNAKSQIVEITEQEYEKAAADLRKMLAQLREYRNNPDKLLEKIELLQARRE